MLVGAAFLVTVAISLIGWLQIFGEDIALAVVDWGGMLVNAYCAALVFSVAFSFKPGERVRRPWMFVGIAVALNAIGDGIYAYYEVVAKTEPYPSLADVPYFAEYAFLLAAILIASSAYRGLVNRRGPYLKALAGSAVVGAVVYFALLRPFILPAGPEDLTLAGKIVSTAYPVMDVLFVFGPALYLVLLISQLGAAQITWPWKAVVSGAFMYAVTDSWYSYADWAGIPRAVSAVTDSGWMIANTLFALGALIAYDVFFVRARA